MEFYTAFGEKAGGGGGRRLLQSILKTQFHYIMKQMILWNFVSSSFPDKNFLLNYILTKFQEQTFIIQLLTEKALDETPGTGLSPPVAWSE